jgi:CRP-like cAMP-binding protein
MLQRSDLIQILRSIPWFLELKTVHLEKLADIAVFKQINAGEKLFNEGDREDFVYVVLEGQMVLEVFVPSHGHVRIFTAEPLDIVGWSSLTPVVRQRTATVRSTLPCSLIAFEGEALRRLCELDHDIGYVVMRRVSNVAASRLLTTRLQLFDIILHPMPEI